MSARIISMLLAAPAVAQEGPTLEYGLPRGHRDCDYAGGLAVTFAGRRASAWLIRLDKAAGRIDPLVQAYGPSNDSSITKPVAHEGKTCGKYDQLTIA